MSLFHFLLLLLSCSPSFPSIPQAVLVAEMARRLISVTGQWASDCQLNQPCVLVGSLQIQTHSQRLTGPHTEAHRGVPLLPSCAEKKKENVAFHSGLTHKHTGVQLHIHLTHNPVHTDVKSWGKIYDMIWGDVFSFFFLFPPHTSCRQNKIKGSRKTVLELRRT